MKFRVQALACVANQQPKGWTLNFRPQTGRPELLDIALIFGGKCGLSNGSGKSPGRTSSPSADQGEIALQLSKCVWTLGDFFLFCANYSHNRTASRVSFGTRQEVSWR